MRLTTHHKFPKQLIRDLSPNCVDRYRRQHLLALVPDHPRREIPRGEWVQLIGASYDRKIYGFEIETQPEQDE
jgi:hypothetical protein